MIEEFDEAKRAFSTFRVLNGSSTEIERDMLFRNMAQLYAYVSNRVDDHQVAQYDEVLCQLASLVEIEARTYVAKLLAPLERAPGNVVVKLANDAFEVAAPLLEFSSVLSDDDLIDIVENQSEAHRFAIAGRQSVPERVGDAIVQHGDAKSVVRLMRNENAELGAATIQRLVQLAGESAEIAADLRGRKDIDWSELSQQIGSAGGKVLGLIAPADVPVNTELMGKVNALVFNRMRNRAGFSAEEWKIAYNQVKALSDRKQLDERALIRFARFGYGHHAAAALTVLLKVVPEVFVKWLAMQDYQALTVALRAYGLGADLFEQLLGILPWRDLPTDADRTNLRKRFEALSREEASDIFDLWREHSFRRRDERKAS